MKAAARLAILTWIAVVALATAAVCETRVVNSPGDGYLNLRTGPGSNFAIVAEMDHGSAVEVLERSGVWLRVRHETGLTGWAHARYLVLLKAGPLTLRVADPVDGWLNLRTGPGTGFAIITRMANGTRVEVLEQSGNWVRVRHEFGAVGWAYRPSLR